VLGEYGLSLTKLESRPRPNRPWEYMFFIDFEGNVVEPRVATALEALRTEALYLKVLGCYPAKATPQVAQASEVKQASEAPRSSPSRPAGFAAKAALSRCRSTTSWPIGPRDPRTRSCAWAICSSVATGSWSWRGRARWSRPR
jgi:hypothetical protein